MEKPSLRATDDPGRSSINDFVRRAAALAAPGARVLDAGAGECIYRPLFDGRRYVSTDRGVGDAGWDYTALDALADLERVPFGAGSFDFVLCTETLEHVARPGRVLAELGRVLKPGGTLALSVPFLHPVHQAPHDYYRYTPYGLRHLLAEAGFDRVEVTSSGGYFTYLRDQLADFAAHLPLALSGRPRSWLSWPYRLLARISAAELRALVGVLRRLDTPDSRPLQYFVIARRPDAIIPPP
ncbi:MAG TPA: methyltransferase domain-containing protein [Planctomycetota bacterium]|nr:methyltransferase domain-containing protein [Planctomycetota bacterium]